MRKQFLTSIPNHVKLVLKIYLLNLVLFLVYRIIFYIINQSSDINTVPVFEKIWAFRMGLEFDTAVFCWITFLPWTIWSVAYFLNKLSIYKIGFYLFLGFQLLYHFICVANIPYFKQFGSHLNKNALLWSEEPSFVFGLIFGSIYYWSYLLLYLFIAIILVKVSFKLFLNFKKELSHTLKPKWYSAIIAFSLFTGLLVLGSRGRISERTGLHEGLAIVSQNNFINQIAINPNFTFWKTVLYNKNTKAYQIPKNIDECIAYTRNYLNIHSPYEKSITRFVNDTTVKPHRYNIVIVVMESMSVFKMGYYGGKNLTPNLDKLNKESVFCNHFFSSGIHTFNGLFSTSTGFPSILSEKALKSYVKNPFEGLGSLLSADGYETYFYTTHDPHFDNMAGFFRLNKFEHFISQYDFDASQAESTLGVSDHVLLDKLIETTHMRKTNKPFMAMVMTASDHGPWKIPTNIAYKPNGETPQDNCTMYADWAIGRFMEQAKKQPWYDNTIFLFLGDHGLSMGHTYEMPLSYNQVPFIIHNPKIFKADTITSPCYQPDVLATVMGIIGKPFNNNTFGINILKEKHPFVVFSADDKIGCVDNNGYYYYKTLNNNERYLRKYKNLDATNYVKQYPSKADSMQKNMMMIYESAQYFIRKNYFLYE
jgi:phosphoglycerol transferase MdoB-like AlkP superfamily enzyme